MTKETFDKAVLMNTDIETLNNLWWSLFHMDIKSGDTLAILTQDKKIRSSYKLSEDVKNRLMQFIKTLKEEKQTNFENL